MDIEEIRIKAFLKLIRYAEHKRDDDGVYLIRYGCFTFSDTSKHPNISVEKWGYKSNAAGAYQFVKGTWDEARSKGIADDFSPSSQDKIARWKLETRGALQFVKSGDIEKAIEKLHKEWTSLPGARQQGITMAGAKKRFDQYVKEYSQ